MLCCKLLLTFGYIYNLIKGSQSSSTHRPNVAEGGGWPHNITKIQLFICSRECCVRDETVAALRWEAGECRIKEQMFGLSFG